MYFFANKLHYILTLIFNYILNIFWGGFWQDIRKIDKNKAHQKNKLYIHLLNKRSPTQVVRFWGRSVMKRNPERAVQIPEQIILVQNFTADLMAQRPDFYPLPFGRYSWMKTGKIRKFRIRPLSASLISVNRPNKKKLIVRKSSLGLPLLKYKRIFLKLIIGRDMNDLVRYPFGTISNHFIWCCR